MPTVPTVTGPSVELHAAPNVQQSIAAANPNAFGAQQARDLGQAAQGLGQWADVMQRQKDREDADALFRAETALKTDYLTFERDELGKQGADAKGAAERATKWWGEAGRKYSVGVQNGRVRGAFERSRTALQLASTETLMRHAQVQENKSLQESALAKVTAAQDMAIGDPTPERVGNARKEISDAVEVVSRIRGDTPEITALSKLKHLTDLHKGIVMSLVDKDPDAAKAYYYGNKKEILGSDRPVIEKALEHGGRLAKAQEVADEAMGKFKTLSEATAYVQANYHGEDEKAITQEVHSRFLIKDADFKRGQEEAYDRGRLMVARGQRVPTDLLLTMGDGHAAALIEHQQAKLKADGAGTVKTDMALYSRLRRLAIDDPEGFRKYDLGRHLDKLGKTEFEQLADLQGQVQHAPKEVVTLDKQINATIDQLKLSKDEEGKGRLQAAVYNALAVEQKAKGKELTYDERQKVIDRQTMEMTVPGFIFDSTKPAYAVTPEEAAKAKVKIPDFDRKQITDALKKRGKPVTEQAIVDLYKRARGL